MNNHQQKRQELYIKAYELTHNEACKFTRDTKDLTNISSNQAKLAIERFDSVFPDPSPQNEAFEAMKRDLCAMSNELQDIRKLLGCVVPNEDLIPKIKMLQKADIILTKIEEDYKLTSSGNRYLVTPKSSPLTDKIVPERDTQHHPESVPPEYLEHDSLKCINNECDPGCNDCGRLDSQEFPADYTGWVKDGTASNKILAYARNGKIYYGITVKGNWTNIPAGKSIDKTHIIAPIEEVNKVLKQFALNLRLVKHSDRCQWQGDSFVKFYSEINNEENYLVLLDYEGNWLPF